MCGIIITNLQIENIEQCNKFCKNRGPDHTEMVTINGIRFIHNLLHITGGKKFQPLRHNNCVAIFNGEIYNYKELYKDSITDGDCIIPTYLKKGDTFIKEFDGDFCVVLFDFENKKLFISGDTFATKPLFFHISSKAIIIASYLSCCRAINNNLRYNHIRPNECLIFSLNNYTNIERYTITDFNLEQYKTNYDDWNYAFEKAVLKRIPDNSVPLVCLSSGMDSGAITCCVNKYNKPIYPVSIKKNENEEVLNSRKKIHNNLAFLNLSEAERIKWKHHLINNCEPCYWDWRYNPRVANVVNAFNMGSMLGSSLIFDYIKKHDKNCRVVLSGIGADEIMARNFFYSLGTGQVDEFPPDLKNVYPWINFFEGSQANYIRGQEYVGGCFNFETRYPFLDKSVVQEFLNLKSELKNEFDNNKVKPVLSNYLTINKYPFHKTKLGFNV